MAEVIETMEDLVQFLKDLSPCLSKVSMFILNVFLCMCVYTHIIMIVEFYKQFIFYECFRLFKMYEGSINQHSCHILDVL